MHQNNINITPESCAPCANNSSEMHLTKPKHLWSNHFVVPIETSSYQVFGEKKSGREDWRWEHVEQFDFINISKNHGAWRSSVTDFVCQDLDWMGSINCLWFVLMHHRPHAWKLLTKLAMWRPIRLPSSLAITTWYQFWWYLSVFQVTISHDIICYQSISCN